MSLHLAWPWLAVALPLPLAVRLLLPPASSHRDAALAVPALDDFADLQAGPGVPAERRRRMLLALAAWCLVVLAAMRPQQLGLPVEVPVSGRDLMLAVDLSGSMEQMDFEIAGTVVDRLTAAKEVASEFIDRRRGDRIGLILFGRQAYLQAPLTFDRETVKQLLEEAVIGLAGKETAIGDAIALAVKHLRDERTGEQVLVLMTDGANTAGELDPLKAAELASRHGIRIYTVGIGAEEVAVRGLFGHRRTNPSIDLDEVTLRGIAGQTGGQYFRARHATELERIYALLDEIEPVAKDARSFRPRRELFPWPLAAALALATWLALPAAGRLTLPVRRPVLRLRT